MLIDETLAPQVVSLSFVLFANFYTLLYSLRYFAFNVTLFNAWIETLGIALIVGFGFVDIVVIITRNNIAWTKRLMPTRKYQVIEKFVVAPTAGVFKWIRVTFLGLEF